jgi:hypothetical protein
MLAPFERRRARAKCCTAGFNLDPLLRRISPNLQDITMNQSNAGFELSGSALNAGPEMDPRDRPDLSPSPTVGVKSEPGPGWSTFVSRSDGRRTTDYVFID